MMRSIFVSLFFFFGPALLLFILRNITLLLMLRAKNKYAKDHEPEIIDVTPVEKPRAPNWFYALVIVISLTCAVTVFLNLETGDIQTQNYVPAHVNESGKIVTGGWKAK